MEVPLRNIIWGKAIWSKNAFKKTILVFLLTYVSASYDFVVSPEFGEKWRDLNITSYEGQTSRLPCTVKHLAGKRVSWIRQRDLQVLSTGRVTFSTDMRISVLPGPKYMLRKPRAVPKEPEVADSALQASFDDERQLDKSKYPLASSSWSFDLDRDMGESLVILRQRNQSHIFIKRINENTDICQNRCRSNLHRNRKLRKKERSGCCNKHKITEAATDINGEVSENSENSQLSQTFKRYKRKHKNPPTTLYDRQRFLAETGGLFQSIKKKYAPKKNSRRRFRKSLKESHLKVDHLPRRSLSKRTGSHQSLDKNTSPIAIYPQAPISFSSDIKSLQPGPNYIDGVWEPEDYALQIKNTKPEDAGVYICQINTEPRMTQAVTLRIVKVRAEILGRRELFVKVGNPVRLSCRVSHGVLSPGFILWYKGNHLVEYENSGGRIQVMTEAGGVSHLLLRNAQPEDSANYTCSPAGGAPASLILNVIVDERQAAMQQGNHGQPSASAPPILWPISVLLPLLSHPFNIHNNFKTYIIMPCLLLSLFVLTSWKLLYIILCISCFILEICKSKYALLSIGITQSTTELTLITKRLSESLESIITICLMYVNVLISKPYSCMFPINTLMLFSIICVCVFVLFTC